MLSCKSGGGTANNKEIIEDPVFRDLAGKLLIRGEDKLMVSNDITLTDSVLTMVDMMTAEGRFFLSYSLDDGRFLYSFGSKGHGPQEFTGPVLSFKPKNKVKDKFRVYDINSLRSAEITIRSDTAYIAQAPSPGKLGFCFNLNKTDDGTYFGTRLGDYEGLYFMFDESQETFKWVEYSSEFDKDIDPRYKYDAYYCDMCVNEEKRIVVAALRYFNKVLFFDFDGNLIKEVQLGKTEITPRWDRVNNVVDHELGAPLCFIEVQMTDNYVYCVYLGLSDERSEIQDPSEVYVFDYDLNLAAAFRLDRAVSKIAVDRDDRFFAGTTDDGTGLTDIVKYDLPKMK